MRISARSTLLRSLLPAAFGALTVLAARPAAGAPGDLDPDFGTGGVVTLALGSSSIANGVALQTDGKIVVAGQVLATSPVVMSVVRLDENGDPDPSFGSGGAVTVPSAVQSVAYDVAIQQPGGEILLAGSHLLETGADDYRLVRLLPADGSLDSSFGDAGIVVTPASSTDGRGFLALESDGKILLGGAEKRPKARAVGGARDFLLLRYLADGTLDPAFGENGRTVVNAGGRVEAIEGLVLQSDGKVVAGGYAISRGKGRFGLTRVDAGGNLDRSFGRGGRFRKKLVARWDYAHDFTGLPGGGILGAGISFDGRSSNGVATIAQFTPDGALDPAFGTDGVVTIVSPPSALYFPRAVVRQADGKIVLAGSLDGPAGLPTGGILVARLLADGTLDPSFGTGGIATTLVGTQATAHDVALQADGKIVVAGYALIANSAQMVVARYLP